MSSSKPVKASELLGKSKADLTKQLAELKEELLTLRSVDFPSNVELTSPQRPEGLGQQRVEADQDVRGGRPEAFCSRLLCAIRAVVLGASPRRRLAARCSVLTRL